ncbi:GAF domain-containing protein [Deinococcus malanensis]|uniref:GAF domain-containing protein n=1 Tax=Deinococcus malanensis TaxID=1706855 RepID=UPI00363721EC
MNHDQTSEHERENERLLELARFDILDTLPEAAYDNIVWLAAHTLNVPIAAINFVDDQRQWSKACIGTLTLAGDRRHSFCAHVVHTRETMVVPNTRQDPRFQHNPFVTGEPTIQFYAGAPIITGAGHVIGSLCAIDRKPRLPFSQQEREVLERFAALVASELELRVSQRAVEQTLAYAQATNARLQASEAQNTALLSAIPDTLIHLNNQGRVLSLQAGALSPLCFAARSTFKTSCRPRRRKRYNVPSIHLCTKMMSSAWKCSFRETVWLPSARCDVCAYRMTRFW